MIHNSMKKQLNFKLYLEEFKDIFGFTDEMKDSQPIAKVVDEKPIMPFNSNRMLEYLASQKVGVQEAFQDFSNTVQWGTEPGSIRVRIGSQYTVYLERLI